MIFRKLHIENWTELSSILSQITRLTDRRTDRRTDGGTDGQTKFSSLDLVCIACSAVNKIGRLHIKLRTN